MLSQAVEHITRYCPDCQRETTHTVYMRPLVNTLGNYRAFVVVTCEVCKVGKGRIT